MSEKMKKIGTIAVIAFVVILAVFKIKPLHDFVIGA